MFAQIYFGVISSTLLSFLPKELEGYFKNTFIFPLSFQSLCSLLFYLILSVFLPWPTWIQLGLSSVMAWKRPAVWPGHGDLPHCHADPRLLSIHVCWSSCNWWKSFCRSSQRPGPLLNAKLVVTGHVLYVRRNLCGRSEGKGIDNYWAYEVRISMLVAVKIFSLNPFQPLCKVSISVAVLEFRILRHTEVRGLAQVQLEWVWQPRACFL